MVMAPFMMLFFFVVSSSSVKIAVAQIPSCAQSLVPCGAFMNVTSPPPSCCDVLKETIEKEFTCLCKLYTAPNFFSNLNINKTQALTLPARCKISGGSCFNDTAPTSQPTPVTPGNNGHSVGAISLTSICTMLLFWVSFMFHE